MPKTIIPEVTVKEDGDTLQSPVIFISEYKGLGVLGDDPKPICRFSPFALMHPVYGQISKGHYVCASKKIFDKLIAHKGLGTTFKIVKRLPRETDRMGNIIMRDAQASGGQRLLHELSEEERRLYRHLVETQARYFTKESDYTSFKETIQKDETKNRVLREIDAIKEKLNLREV